MNEEPQTDIITAAHALITELCDECDNPLSYKCKYNQPVCPKIKNLRTAIAKAETAETREAKLCKIVKDLLRVMPTFPAAAEGLVGFHKKYDDAITQARTILQEKEINNKSPLLTAAQILINKICNNCNHPTACSTLDFCISVKALQDAITKEEFYG